MKSFLLVLRSLCLCLILISSANVFAQGTQIQGPRDSADVYSGVVYGPIDQSDTLWAISSQYRQNKQFTVYQVMLAIYELNPRAFSNRNFNTMITGSMLQLPTDRYIARIDPQRALRKAQQDDRTFQNATGQAGNSIPSLDAPSATQTNLKPDVPLVNKEELDAAQQSFQNEITSLKRQQRQVVDQLRQQLDSTITATQEILNENQAVLEQLAKKDEEMTVLRTEISDQFNAELAEQAAEIEQLKQFVKIAQAKEKLEDRESVGTLIREPMFIIIATTFASLLIFVLIAMMLLRKPKEKVEPVPVSEDEDLIDLDDPASQDADDLLALLDADDMSDDDLLDDILSDDLEDTIDELSPEIEDFDALEDEMLVPDQKDDNKGKSIKASDDSADSDSDDFDVDSLDADSLDGEISLDDDDFSLDDNAENDDELQEIDIDQVLGDENVDIANTVDESEVDELTGDKVESTVNDAVKETSDEIGEDESASIQDGSTAELAPDDVTDVGDSAPDNLTDSLDEEVQDEVDIDDLLEQNALDDGDVPDGIDLGRSGEIDEAVIDQIEASVADKNIEINTLTENLEAELANVDFDEELDISDYDEEIDSVDSTGQNSEQQKKIQSIDDITKDVEDDIADALADIDSSSDDIDMSDLEDPLSDELLSELGAELPEDDGTLEDLDALLDESLDDLATESTSEDIDLSGEDIDLSIDANESDTLADATPDDAAHEDNDNADLEAEEIDIDSVLDDSLDDLLNNHIDDDDIQANKDALLDEILEPERETQSDVFSEGKLPETASDVESDATEKPEADTPDLSDDLDILDENLEDVGVLDDIDLSELDDELSNNAAKENENVEIDDSILDLPDLDDWLGDDEKQSDLSSSSEANTEGNSEKGEESVSNDLDKLPDDYDDLALSNLGDTEEASTASTEDEVLQEIENADFDSLLEEMGTLEDDDIGSKLAELEANNDISTSTEKGLADSAQNNSDEAPKLDNPDLDLTALFDDPDGDNDATSDFIDVDNLIEESEKLAPASDDEIELNLDMSLDSFLNDSESVDVDFDADQASNLDLARVYIDMEDKEAATEALEQVLKKGNDEQKEEASKLIQSLKE